VVQKATTMAQAGAGDVPYGVPRRGAYATTAAIIVVVVLMQ